MIPGITAPGQALGLAPLVVGEAGEVHLGRLDEPPHGLQRDVRALLGQLVAELDVVDVHRRQSCLIMRQSTVATSRAVGVVNVMRLTMNTIVPERPVLA